MTAFSPEIEAECDALYTRMYDQEISVDKVVTGLRQAKEPLVFARADKRNPHPSGASVRWSCWSSERHPEQSESSCKQKNFVEKLSARASEKSSESESESESQGEQDIAAS